MSCYDKRALLTLCVHCNTEYVCFSVCMFVCLCLCWEKEVHKCPVVFERKNHEVYVQRPLKNRAGRTTRLALTNIENVVCKSAI